jgi:DNA-binding transcriptional LysR family regulator
VEIRWLEDFVALARIRHFSRAADAQYVSQPTFSRRIKLLEEEMGVQLVDRNTLPLSLTPAGELFLAAAEKITRILRDTRDDCRAIHEEQSSRLVFAMTESLYLSLYKTWLEPFSSGLGVALDLNLHSTSWSARDFGHAILAGQCDAILCYWHDSVDLFRDVPADTFEHLTLGHERLVPCSAPDAAGEARHRLPGTRRRPIPFIDYHDNAILKPIVQQLLGRHADELHLDTVNTNFHPASVKAMIREGFGVGWIPLRLARESLRHGRLLAAGDERHVIDLEVRVYRLRNNAHPGLEQLWSALRRGEAPIDVVDTPGA